MCAFEIKHMRRFAARRAAPVAFVDFYSGIRTCTLPELAPAPAVVREQFDLGSPLVRARLMYRMHALEVVAGHTTSASVVVLRGLDAFRALYSAAGFERFAALTHLPIVNTVMERAYEWFASNRHRIVPRADGLPPCELCVTSDPDAKAAP